MGQLVKIGFPCHALTVYSGSGLYIHRVTTAVHLVTIPYVRFEGFQGEPHFLSTVHLFSNS
jgi:hypothetical protein